MTADWRAVHALLAEHFEFSLGARTTGFQVEPQDPVVVIHHIANSHLLRPVSRDSLCYDMLRQYEKRLNAAGYPTLWGQSVRSGERALIVMDKDT